MSKTWPDTATALQGLLHDGMSIMVGGFGLCGVPENLVAEICRSGIQNLVVISSNMGTDSGGAGALLRTGQTRKVIASYSGGNRTFERLVLEGVVEWEMVPQGTFFERIRAAGAGIAGFYTPTGAETDIAQGREVRDFDGRPHLFERALRADLALIKAFRGDPLGNLVYRKTARNGNPVMATAAEVVICEVEELVGPGDLDPDQVHTPGIYIDRILQGAHYVKPIEFRTTRPRPESKNPHGESAMPRESILVVDNHPDRIVARYALTTKGYSVEVVDDLVQARARLETLTPDIVVLDCQQACESTLGFVGGLKADPSTADIAAVAYTACPRLMEPCPACQNSFDRTVPKGRLDLLSETLDDVLRSPVA